MEFIFDHLLPEEIEKRSFEIITQELGAVRLDEDKAAIIKRVIHATADFDYAQNLCFSEGVVAKALDAIKNGASIVTDTKMASAGINAKKLEKFGGQVYCFMADADIAAEAKAAGTTRASACMEKAATIGAPVIVAIGNAPTALIKLAQLIKENRFKPELIIGVPVGFVNVVESKELIMQSGVPYIVAKGRKGGSTVAAAVCNALIYSV
jgi:precorrin-8X/cobalt-precorrin-8 methylmutase